MESWYTQRRIRPQSFGPFDGYAHGANPYPYQLDSSAGQMSLLMSNSIIVTNTQIEADYDFRSSASSFDYGTANAKEICEITFSVQTPTICSLNGVEANDSLGSFPLASLTSSNHGIITTATMYGHPWVYLGVLQPDTYVLTADMDLHFLAPGADFDGGNALMYVTLNALPPPQVTAVNVNSNTVQLSVSTAAGSTNRVLMSTDLTTPVSQWQPISTNVADTNGVFQFTNSIAPGQDAEFFRISVP